MKKSEHKLVEDLTGVLAELVESAACTVARRISPFDERMDATGERVDSLSTAVMGMTTGLTHIAPAIESLADAVQGHGQQQQPEPEQKCRGCRHLTPTAQD